MITNSYHHVTRTVDLMFTPGSFKPFIPFTPATYALCFKYPSGTHGSRRKLQASSLDAWYSNDFGDVELMHLPMKTCEPSFLGVEIGIISALSFS